MAKMQVEAVDGLSTQAGLDRPCPARGAQTTAFPGWFVVEAVISSYRPILIEDEGGVGTAAPCKSAHFTLKISRGM